MKLIGTYTCNLVGVIFTGFAVIFLTVLGFAFYYECAALIDEFSISSIHDDKLTIDIYKEESKLKAKNCWLAAFMYVVLLFCFLHQMYLHNWRNTYETINSVKEGFTLLSRKMNFKNKFYNVVLKNQKKTEDVEMSKLHNGM